MLLVFMGRLTSAQTGLLSFRNFFCQVDRRFRGQSLACLGLALLAVLGAPLSAAVPSAATRGLIWEAPVVAGQLPSYRVAVADLLQAYESKVGQDLQPGERGQVALKVDTRGGRGLATPLPLIQALIEALEQRGFAREAIWIVDLSAADLRQAGLLPPLSSNAPAAYLGCPVLAWDAGAHRDPDWFYDSPLPSAMHESVAQLERFVPSLDSAALAQERQSFLPMPLMFEVDFWINLASGVDSPALGVDGVLANATLWNVSNSLRFLVNPASASAAVAEIAAIPELSERWILNFVPLETYQYIGGPAFNSLYTRSEPKLWLSCDPVALDRLLYERFNQVRRLQGFPEIDPLPRQLPFAASLGLGVYEKSQIRVELLGAAAADSAPE